jgi:hypothetical protein
MRGFQMTAVTAGLVGGAMLLFGAAAPASAATLPSLAVTAPAEASMVEQVQRRGDHRARRGDRARRYDRQRHGPRYSYRRPGFHYHYGGHYYSSPWWTGPSIGFGITVPGVTLGLGGRSSAHVQWCHNRFRSYNAATDSYLGYDGRYHRCNSPY